MHRLQKSVMLKPNIYRRAPHTEPIFFRFEAMEGVENSEETLVCKIDVRNLTMLGPWLQEQLYLRSRRRHYSPKPRADRLSSLHCFDQPRHFRCIVLLAKKEAQALTLQGHVGRSW